MSWGDSKNSLQTVVSKCLRGLITDIKEGVDSQMHREGRTLLFIISLI